MEKDRFCKPNIVSYNTVINGLCKDGLFVDALSLFSEMACNRVLPDVFTFFNSCSVHVRSMERGFKVINEMVDPKITPDVYTFSVFVDMLCKEGKFANALGLLKIMVQRGVKPDTITYNLLLNGYCL